jgi:N-carbamoyl-L-amino-acid hydrolase
MTNETNKNKSVRVNTKRIEDRLKELATFGINSNGGIDRSFGSDEDVKSRQWLGNLWFEAFHQKTKVDAAANLWNGIDGAEQLKPIVIGSHHDAVANGGKYDGALGVLLATEVMQSLLENGYPLRHPMKIVSFSAEEPNPYGISTLGSRSITGVLKKEDLESTTHHESKEELVHTIKRLGGDVDALEEQVLQQNELSAFMECHIEQGRNLYDQKIPLAVVTKITGIYREKIKIIGEANHSGTTMMKDRHDAMLAGAELSLALEEIITKQKRNDVVGTVGQFDIFPDSINIIPGEVELIAEIRTPSKAVLDDLVNEFSNRIHSIEKKRGVQIVREVILNQASVPMHDHVQGALRKSIDSLGESFLDLTSMAGHDSVHMAKITKTGMLFVPSIEGESHCPSEKTNLLDIAKAGNVLLQAVITLDEELD